MAHYAFISYSAKDKETADAICRAIEANRIRCWYAPRDIRGGANWTASIMDALASSGVMIVVWSSTSNGSKDVIREVQHAFKKNVPVIPFRIDDFVPAKELEYYLASVQWLDATTPTLTQHLQRLVQQVRAILPPDAQVASAGGSPTTPGETEEDSAPEFGAVPRMMRFGKDSEEVAEPDTTPGHEINPEGGGHEKVEEPPILPASLGNAAPVSLSPSETISPPRPVPDPNPSASEGNPRIEHHGPLARMERPRGCVIAGSVAFVLALAMTFVVMKPTSNTAWQDTPRNREIDIANGVASRVNGKPIMLNEVNRALDRQSGARALSPLELKQVRLQVLDSLIQREALVQRAEKGNLMPTDEQVTAAIEQQKQQAGMTDEEFQTRLRAESLTMEAFREESRKQLAIINLQNEWTGRITVSDAELEDYYNKNKQKFMSDGGIGLANIVADPADNGLQDDAKSDAEAKQKIDSIYQQLRGGADFRTVARARTEDSSRERDGDVGFATGDDLKNNGFPDELIRKLDSIAVGDITAPVRFANGRWYIFKLTDRREPNTNLTLESPGIREQVTNTLFNERKQSANAELLKTALSDSKVVNYLADNQATP